MNPSVPYRVCRAAAAPLALALARVRPLLSPPPTPRPQAHAAARAAAVAACVSARLSAPSASAPPADARCGAETGLISRSISVISGESWRAVRVPYSSAHGRRPPMALVLALRLAPERALPAAGPIGRAKLPNSADLGVHWPVGNSQVASGLWAPAWARVWAHVWARVWARVWTPPALGWEGPWCDSVGGQPRPARAPRGVTEISARSPPTSWSAPGRLGAWGRS